MDDGYLIQPSFPSTHPVWGGTVAGTIASAHDGISIHPPRVGWDLFKNFRPAYLSISIHPPRVGWDRRQRPTDAAGHDFNPPTPCGVGPRSCTPPCGWKGFQSTHPVWGGTAHAQADTSAKPISIHPPRVGWDRPCTSRHKRKTDFNPPTPCGVGQARTAQGLTANAFQSAHPVWGGTDSAINP